MNEILNFVTAFRLHFVAQAEPHHILAVDGVNRVVIRKINGQKPNAGNFRVELGQLTRRFARSGYKHVIQGRLDNVTNSGNLEELVPYSGPGLGGLEGKLRAGVEHGSIALIQRGVPSLRLAIMSEAPAKTGREVQPAKIGLRQEELMERVGPHCGVGIQVSAFFGLETEITEGRLAFIKKRGDAELLPGSRELHIRQALDRAKEIVDLRLS